MLRDPLSSEPTSEWVELSSTLKRAERGFESWRRGLYVRSRCPLVPIAGACCGGAFSEACPYQLGPDGPEGPSLECSF